MSPPLKFQKEDILKAALILLEQKGVDALSARAIAQKMGSSVKPIFTIYENMQALKEDVIAECIKTYTVYIQREIDTNLYPPYKAIGMAYIRFAKEKKELFKLLFMRDRSIEDTQKSEEEIKPILALLQKNLNLSYEDAYRYHLEMWIYVHGIATMLATSYLDWDMHFVSQMLTDAFEGLKKVYQNK